jgi:hypothetical protein
MKKEIITAALEAALWIDSNDPSAAALVVPTDPLRHASMVK